MKCIHFAVAAVAAILLATPPVFAETYTYRDASGTVSYVDDLGKVPARYRAGATKLGEMEPISVMDSDAPAAGAGKRKPGRPAAREKKRFDGTIELYVTAWCPVCTDAEGYIKKMGYPYVKYDIEKDSAARKRSADYPGRGVPLVVVGEKNFRGFSGDTLEYYMGK